MFLHGTNINNFHLSCRQQSISTLTSSGIAYSLFEIQVYQLLVIFNIPDFVSFL